MSTADARKKDHPLRTLAALVLFFGATGLVVLAADRRIFTNPAPDKELKQLFPGAAAFSALVGNPLHFTAYAADPQKSPSTLPLGFAFWTTDFMPKEHGYHGPIHMLVGLDMSGVITGVVVDYDSEPYGYFSVQPPQFAAQFKGKSIRDPFRVGADIDAVSRASMTITSAARAVRDSSRLAAKLFLPAAAVKP